MKSKILQYLQNKYSGHDIDELLSVSCFLDPRFKTEYIDSPAVVAMVKDCLAREGVELIPEDDRTAVQTQVEITEIQLCPIRRKLGSWLKEAKGTALDDTTTLIPEEKMEKEIEDYLKDPTLDEESNPLEWWKLHAAAFPTLLAKLANKIPVCLWQ